jgi:hypothetical protein
VDLARISCYIRIHPELKSRTDRSSENQAYVVGQKERSLDMYKRRLHNPNFKKVKALVPEIYARNSIRFWARGTQFRDNDFETKIRLRRYYRDSLCDRCIWR